MISLNWLKDYVDISNISPEDLASDITQAGVNVEKIISNNIDNLITGQIVSCYPHPNSDHLNICQVDIGSKIIQIICGAKNVRQNLKVIVALPGSILPGNHKISSSIIRGEESNGMICALLELGLEENTIENYEKGIYELPDNIEVGINPLTFLGLDDTTYELDIHKHRNNDCYYHIGFAYEVAAILNKKVKLPDTTYQESTDSIHNHLKLTVNTLACPYYLAKIVTNIHIKESPDFIKQRLISVGMKPINNVVDISNYVMLEFGQPMHFFDKDKLGNEILVRQAKDQEKMMTLHHQEKILDHRDIVITDGQNPISIAGVMGGLATSIDDKTQSILIESAIFDPISIRYTASKLNLKSEASIRYGKGLNYEYAQMALDRACHLLSLYADATILKDTLIHDKIDKNIKKVTFSPEEINKILGLTISPQDISQVLRRLDFSFTQKDATFTVTIPPRRLDIDPFVNDIAEEIGRLYGYHNLTSTQPISKIKAGQYCGNVKYLKLLSKRLRSLGLNEVKTYNLVSPELSRLFDYENKKKIILPNPLSNDKAIFRTSLLPSLLMVYDYNHTHKVEDILIYEISKTYDYKYCEEIKIGILMKGNYLASSWQNNRIPVDFYLAKGIVENILNYLGFKNRYDYQLGDIKDMHPGISAQITLDKEVVGIVGKIHPQVRKDDIYLIELSLNKLLRSTKKITFKPSSKYPEIKKDVSFIVDQETTCQMLIDAIRKSGGRLLSDIKLFDIFKDTNNQKSLAFTLTFKDDTRTLTDEEVMQRFNQIILKVTDKCHAKLKSI